LNLSTLKARDHVKYRRSAVGFVWQQTAHNLLSYLTARENIELPMAFSGVKPAERRERAARLLESVGLRERAEVTPARLSGGEQQRVALAVAMANLPQLLLADEPTGEVDSESAAAIFKIMADLNREYGVTIVIVTHDPEVAHRVNRVVGMRDGRVSIEVLRRQGVEGAVLTPEEFAVLDRTGRLQLPHAYREALGMRGLVRVKLRDDHIAIYPADDPAGDPLEEGDDT
jgi:ABC-type lipoprotein export system ATPase subunit